MRAFMSIMLGVSICVLMMVANWMFASSEDDERIGTNDMVLAIALGAMVGCINYFAPMFYIGTAMVWMPPVMLIAMVLFTVYTMYWWHADGSNFYELIPFVIMAVLSFFTAKATAVMTAGLVGDAFWYSVILVIPEVMLALAIGYYIVNLFLFRYNELGRNDLDKLVAIIAGVITALVILVILVNRVNWNSLGANDGYYVDDVATDTGATDTTAVAETPSDYGFYNYSLLSDGDARNDFNFGPNPYTEGATAKAYDADLRYRMSKDPALAAADMAWLDAIVGTRYLGEFYESCKGDWAKTINLTKERFMADTSLWYQTLSSFFAFLNTADGVSLDYKTSDLTDQMYMNPYTVNSVPDVIVMTTTEHSGYFLTYTFVIKGNVFTVSYRIDCGYQPTNVQKVMDIKPDDTPRSNPTPQPQPQPVPTPQPQPQPVPTPQPQPTPTPVPTPTPETEKPKPTPETEKPKPETEVPTPETEKPKPEPETEPKPKPEPETEPKPTPETEIPKKDPSKSPTVNTQPNDDPGPGPNTNAGVGATTSTADQPTNSNHYETVEEYRQDVEELKVINQEQKTGNDPSIPSTPPTATAPVANVDSNVNAQPSTQPVTVDNNGDTGSVVKEPSGEVVKVEPINTPTPVAPLAVAADTGQAISDSPGEAWGGPAD